MFKDYFRAVLKAYHDKVTSNTISLNLISLTPASVRRECTVIYKERFRKTDERILAAFFGHTQNDRSYLQVIERCDIDKFKPMINFIEGRSKETDVRNVELLAWLIDFKDRPFDHNGIYGGLNQPFPVDEPQVGGNGRPNMKTGLKKLLSAVTRGSSRPAAEQKPSGNLVSSRVKRKILFVLLMIALFTVTLDYLNLNSSVFRSESDTKGSVSQQDNFKFSQNRVKTPSSSIYGQCQAITKKKTQCSRKARPGGFCWQHQKKAI